MEIGEKIKQLRKDSKMKQKDLAKISGISSSFLCDIEKGRTKPSLDTLIKISNALKINIKELF